MTGLLHKAEMGNGYEQDYAKLVKEVLLWGEKDRNTRNGKTTALFGTTLRFNMRRGFPLLSCRKLFYKPVIGEFAAMLKGPKNIADFKKYGCNYWDAWGAEPGACLFDGELAEGGELELDYGNSWINFNGVNQIQELVYNLKTDPTGRRHIVTGWRPDRLKELSLPCCHMLYQFYIREGGYLDMLWYQRSADLMIGVPADAILAATWMAVLANELGEIGGHPIKPGVCTMAFGDTHIYKNHLDGAAHYLDRVNSRSFIGGYDYDVSPWATLSNFEPEMLTIDGYTEDSYMPAIKFPLNV